MVWILVVGWLAIGVYGLALCRVASRLPPVPPRRRDVKQLELVRRQNLTLVDPGAATEADASDSEERIDGYHFNSWV
jgi:hypothetical protein